MKENYELYRNGQMIEQREVEADIPPPSTQVRLKALEIKNNITKGDLDAALEELKGD